MSPAPARTSRAAIVAAARELLEEGGLDAVSMAAVAGRVGVRPPSLYKHLHDRAELLLAMVDDAAHELTRALDAATQRARADAAARTVAVADAYRTFAHTYPRAAALLFTDLGADRPVPQARLADAARPVLDVARALAGERDALPAARTLTAFVYGFTTMESAGAFRLGGDVDAAFHLGISALVRGLAR